MKLLSKSRYSNLEIAEQFNRIILNKIDGYEGKKKEQLKSFCEDLQRGGCISGMIGDFIYNSDCKEFYIANIDELEQMKSDLEEDLGESIKNRHEVLHYTFVCWLSFEEYCYDLYNNIFEN